MQILLLFAWKLAFLDQKRGFSLKFCIFSTGIGILNRKCHLLGKNAFLMEIGTSYKNYHFSNENCQEYSHPST